MGCMKTGGKARAGIFFSLGGRIKGNDNGSFGGSCVTTIFLCGKRGGDTFAKTVTNAAVRYGGAQICGGGRLRGSAEPAFLIYECESPPGISIPKGILVFKDSFSSGLPSRVPGGFLAVFSEGNTAAARALEGTGISAVTCGTAARDTVSAASLGFPQSVVSLQRSIRTLSGTVLEPHDIPVTLREPYPPEPLLAASAVLLIAGIPSGAGYEF